MIIEVSFAIDDEGDDCTEFSFWESEDTTEAHIEVRGQKIRLSQDEAYSLGKLLTELFE